MAHRKIGLDPRVGGSGVSLRTAIFGQRCDSSRTVSRYSGSVKQFTNSSGSFSRSNSHGSSFGRIDQLVAVGHGGQPAASRPPVPRRKAMSSQSAGRLPSTAAPRRRGLLPCRRSGRPSGRGSSAGSRRSRAPRRRPCRRGSCPGSRSRRDLGRALVGHALVLPVVLAAQIAVVGGEDDDRVVEQLLPRAASSRILPTLSSMHLTMP